MFNLRELLDAPLGDPAPGRSEIDDLLIDGAGQIAQVIVEADTATSAQPREVPWSDVQLIRGNGRLIANLDVEALPQRPPFYGPVAGTLGGPDAVLASKLLGADVRSRLGSGVGTVQDVIFNITGKAQTVVIATAQGAIHTPWVQLSIQPDRASQNVPGGAAEAVVVWSR